MGHFGGFEDDFSHLQQESVPEDDNIIMGSPESQERRNNLCFKDRRERKAAAIKR